MRDGAEQLIRSLEAQGVEYVFGVCGDTSVGLYHAFHDLEHDLEHILTRDERSASFMADAYSRLSDKPGVCEGPSGGGATYLLPGLAEANDSSIPLVALNTTIPVKYRGRGVLTELSQDEIFRPVTKWACDIDHIDHIPGMVRRGFTKATSGRPGAVHLTFPMDVLNQNPSEDVYGVDETRSCPAYRPAPPGATVKEAVDLIDQSENPVIVTGGGVHTSRAWQEVRELAETVGIPVASSLTGTGAIGDSPYDIGVVGENGFREYANEIIREGDLLILCGTAVESVWTKKWSQPPDREKHIIHIDIDPDALGKNYYTDVKLQGDLRRSLRMINKNVERAEKCDPDELTRRHDEWIRPYREQFAADAFPLRPERIVADTQAALPDDAVLISDPGTSAPYFAAMYEFPVPGRHWITPRAHGALGYAIPGAIGAHFARPEAEIVGFTGDGSFATCAGELETLRRYDIPVTIVVINNSAFSWIEAGQRNFNDFAFGVEFGECNYARIAEEFGVDGFRVEAPDEYREAVEASVASSNPSLIDVPTVDLPSLSNAPVDWLEPET